MSKNTQKDQTEFIRRCPFNLIFFLMDSGKKVLYSKRFLEVVLYSATVTSKKLTQMDVGRKEEEERS